jgi:hypothetical protein
VRQRALECGRSGVGKFILSVDRYERKVRLADRGRGDHGAYQTNGQAGWKASNERVTEQKDEKSLVWLYAMIRRS